MIELGNFNDPWNLRTLGLLAICFFSFDILGFILRRSCTREDSEFLRIADWFWGFAGFALYWFILGYIVPPYGWLVFFSFLLPYLLGGKFYLKQGALGSLKEELKVAWIFFIPFIFFLPAFAIKTSLPPYYSDEMAYHFVSPAFLTNLKTFDWWNLREFSVFNFIPKSLDIFYVTLFSMAKTNVISRALNTLFFFSSFVLAARLLRPQLGTLTGFIFILLFLSVPQSLVQDTTVGFVDIPSTSLRFLGFISGVIALKEARWNLFLFSVGVWGLALATKYASMSGFGAFVVCGIFWSLLYNRPFLKKILNIKNIWTIAAVFLFTGGFWYLKNIIVTGNPVFPFLFPCYRFKETCSTGSEFFGTWTVAVKPENFQTILEQFFRGQNFFLWLIGLGFLISFFKAGRKIKTFYFFALAVIIMEMAVFAKTSGFYLRYHQHLQYILIFLASLAFAIELKTVLQTRMFKVFLVSVTVLIMGSGYRDHIRQTYTSHITPEEKDFFLHKIDIYGFAKYRFKGKIDFINWCEKNNVLVQRYDPDLIWYDDAAYIHQFMTNCFFDGEKFTIEQPTEEIISKIKNEKMKAFIFSANQCMKPEDVKKKREDEDDRSLKMRKLNNLIVCCSRPVDNMVFELDYERLNCSL